MLLPENKALVLFNTYKNNLIFVNHFHPGIIFAGKAGVYMNGAPCGTRLSSYDIIRNYDGQSFIIHDLGELCQCVFEPWFKIVSSMIFDPSVSTGQLVENF